MIARLVHWWRLVTEINDDVVVLKPHQREWQVVGNGWASGPMGYRAAHREAKSVRGRVERVHPR